MAFEIPSARIRELQSAIRREAGVPSYDPDDPSLPPLPSIADVVAALHADLPDSLRCGQCRGALLRGSQSTLCVYCGADRRTEGVAHSISFNSTAACRKLLDFLGLDGSETIVLETESSTLTKSQATPKDELALSDLLDIELRWPSNKEEDSNGSLSKMSPAGTYALNLKGLDVETFFSETKREATSTAPAKRPSKPDEQEMQRKHDMDIVDRRLTESFADFEKIQTSDTRMTSTINKNQEDSSAAWEAEFQSATSENFTSDPKAQDLFQDPSSSEFVQDSKALNFYQEAKRENEIVPESNVSDFANEQSLPSSISNWVSDDFWDGNTGKAVKVNTPDQIKLEYDSTLSDSWIEKSPWSSSNIKESNTSRNINMNDDFDAWKDFAKSKAQGDALDLKVQTENFSENYQEMKATSVGHASSTSVMGNDKFVADNGDSLDYWHDFMSSVERKESLSSMQVQHETISLEHPLETKSAYLLPITGKVESDTSMNSNSNSDLFDAWQDFASSSEARGNLLNPGSPPFEISSFDHSSETKTVDFWPSSDRKESDNNKLFDSNNDSAQDFTRFGGGREGSYNLEPQTSATLPEYPLETNPGDMWPTRGEMESANVNDDSLDDWQDFTSSSDATGGILDSRQNNEPVLFGNVSEIKTMNQMDLILVIQDSVLDAPGSQKHSGHGKELKLDASTSNRMNSVMDLHYEEQHTKIAVDNSDALSNKKSRESSIEMLISQIPDLSFMLVDELSIPKKLDISESSSDQNLSHLP